MFREPSDTGLSSRPSETDASWQRVRTRLRAELGDDVFGSWFSRLLLDRVDRGLAEFSVPTKFLKSWIETHYTHRIAALCGEEGLLVQRVAVAVRPCASAPAAARVAAAPLLPRMAPVATTRLPAADEDGLFGTPIDRRLSFDSFLVGRGNALAHAAAMQVGGAAPAMQAGSNAAAMPAGGQRAREPVGFNPLFIHGAVGLGKTHLLQAIAGAVEASRRPMLYLTAERFMFGFVAALKSQTVVGFKERIRRNEVLLIDDLQFLNGKIMQQEFTHTLNALLDSGQQVVVACDRPPNDLEAFDERLRSRLAGGLAVDVGPLDEELRRKILERRVAAARAVHPGFAVPAEVMDFIVRSITANGRDLEGAVTRLLAHNTLTDRPITLDMAEATLRDLVRAAEPRRVRIEDIQRVVAKQYNVSRADILSSRRTHTVVMPRQIAMYLAKQLTLRSLPEIGRRFGGRDHTTVLHAVRKIDGLVGTDGNLAGEIEVLKRLLQEG